MSTEERDVEALLREAVQAGATIGDFVRMLEAEQSGIERALASAARELDIVRDGELEVDDPTVVSLSSDGGAYVLGWVWVGVEDLRISSFAELDGAMLAFGGIEGVDGEDPVAEIRPGVEVAIDNRTDGTAALLFSGHSAELEVSDASCLLRSATIETFFEVHAENFGDDCMEGLLNVTESMDDVADRSLVVWFRDSRSGATVFLVATLPGE